MSSERNYPRYAVQTRDLDETLGDRIARHAKKNPLVLVGLTGTVAVLVGGIISFFGGNSRLQQTFMRWRVALQGSTVAALGVGAYLESKEAAEARRAESHPIGALERQAAAASSQASSRESAE